MTSTLAQGAGRSPGESFRPLRALAASPALIVLLLGGLALRITIAYVLFPASGFESDIASYVSWALTLGEHGPAGFYANAGFSDYPPAYLYLLWPVGLLATNAADPGAAASELIKLPPMLLDLVVGWFIYRLVLGWSWPGRRAEAMALVAAALYLFNPVSIYDSALWGQTDAAGALILLLGIAALIRGNSEGAAAMAATAAVVKPQFGVVLIPLVVFMLLKRHLVRPGSGPRQRPWAPASIAAWLSTQQGWPRLITASVAALGAFFLLALPFGMGPFEYLEKMFGTAGQYSWLSVNAYNLWALLGSAGTRPLAEAPHLWSPDTVGLLGPLPAVVIGAALLLAGFLWGVVRAAARDDRWTLLVAVTFLAIAFFILPTRVHERYMFPAIALLPLLAVVSGRWTIALVLLSVGAFINFHGILTRDLYGTDNVISLPLGDLFQTRDYIVASALLQTGVGIWAAWQLRPSLRTSPDGYELAASRGTTRVPGAMPPPPGLPYPPPPLGGAKVYPAPSDDVGWVRGPSTLDYIVARLTRPPLRRDRSAELAGERGGRIDRFDVLLLVVLIIGTTMLRGFNLDKPYGMYFDEVYHARTATEFLQRWEYGQSHDIYEFTHPHLAKYAMAWGIRVAGGNEITGSTDLAVPVRGAALERRWSSGTGDDRNGDRLFVGTGAELFVYDLATMERDGTFPIEATALAVDEAAHQAYIADPSGAIFRLDTAALDARRDGSGEPGGLEAFSAGPGAAIDQLVLTDVSLVARAANGSLSTFDLASGELVSQRQSAAVEDAVALPWAERVLVDTLAIDDAAEVAAQLADALDDDERRIEALLTAGHQAVVVDAYIDQDPRTEIEALIDEGDLDGVSLDSAPMLAVAGEAGVRVLDAFTLDDVIESLTDGPASSMVLVERGLGDPTLYVTTGSSLDIVRFGDSGPGLPSVLAMPGEVRNAAWNEPANLVHVLGEAPDGGPTVYVVEPNGNAVFIDVPLPDEPAFLLADTQPERPFDDRGQLLAVGAGGLVTSVGIEQNAFGWRIPGVLLGALAAGLLYLLARVLFARRNVAVIAAVLIVAEGMLFANSRIAMNDVYVSTFIIAAVLLFAPLYLASRRPWTAMALLLGAGVALGLALSAKWVGLFAIGGLLLLVLLRSGLGRILALVGMITLTTILGAMAVGPSPLGEPDRNWTFAILMLALTGLLAAGMVRRPLAVSRGEVWLAALAPMIIGGVAIIVGASGRSLGDDTLTARNLLLAGLLMIAVGLGTLLVAWVAARLGSGPFTTGARAPDASTSGWLRPGWLGGLPWLFTLAALVLLPIGVYILSYAPWVDLGNDWGLPLIGSLPYLPSGETGQTLPELTRSMYQYHDDLRAEHAASSPWWAWPLNLKPVWFYQESFAGPTKGLIYDAGNLVIFWMGLPAMAFAAWAAWRRHSVALAIVVLMWAALLLPWARIDRATFQYHVYASLPFLILALSYFLAELWHGPGPRTWFLARVAAALAILGAPLLWLLRTPLCILADTALAHPDSLVCAAEVTRTAQLSSAGVAALIIVAAGAGVAGLLAWWASRLPPDEGPSNGISWRVLAVVALAGVAVVTLIAVFGVLRLLDAENTTAIPLSSDFMALCALVVLAIPARMALRARDARRFVLGVIGAAVLWLVIWYPNISGLPLPPALTDLYQGLLPTWSWDFQFNVNTSVAFEVDIVGNGTLLIAAVTILFVSGAAVAAYLWDRPQRPSAGGPPG